MIHRPHLSGPGAACLYLVSHKIGIVFIAELPHLRQIAFGRDDDASFALDRLHIERHIAALGQIFFQHPRVSERNMVHALHQGMLIHSPFFFSAHGHGSCGFPVKRVVAGQNTGLARLIPAGQLNELQRSLNGLRSACGGSHLRKLSARRQESHVMGKSRRDIMIGDGSHHILLGTKYLFDFIPDKFIVVSNSHDAHRANHVNVPVSFIVGKIAVLCFDKILGISCQRALPVQMLQLQLFCGLIIHLNGFLYRYKSLDLFLCLHTYTCSSSLLFFHTQKEQKNKR